MEQGRVPERRGREGAECIVSIGWADCSTGQVAIEEQVPPTIPALPTESCGHAQPSSPVPTKRRSAHLFPRNDVQLTCSPARH